MAEGTTTQPAPQEALLTRHEVLVDAAISVLAEDGARGLTHRAVDAKAGLPQGSTSNLFRTRNALFEAVVDRHVQRELLLAANVQEAQSTTDLTVAKAAELLCGIILATASPAGADLTACRYELFLEARRRTELAGKLIRARQGYIELTASLLERAGLPPTRENATATIAFVEGLTVDRLFHPQSAIPGDELNSRIERFLEALA